MKEFTGYMMHILRIILFLICTQILVAGRMEINADKVVAKDQEIHFIGNAKLSIDNSWLHADRVNVYLDENNETRMYEAIGGFVTFEFKHQKHSFKGRASKVSYNLYTSRYILSGKAVIDDNDFSINRRLAGDKIIIDMFTGRVKVHGGPVTNKVFIKMYDFGRAFGL
jgi:lipopolysaccharide export system protein LptA